MSRFARRAFAASVPGLVWLCAAAALAPPAMAQAVPTESAIKAAYLHRFLSYVEWPASALPEAADAPFVLGVMGSLPVAGALQTIVAGRQFAGRPIEVRLLATAQAPLDGLHVLFIGRGVAADKVIPRLAQRPVLVVTEGESVPGTMLNFVVVDGRVRFEAAPATAEQAGLKLGARLLAIAERVQP